MADTVKLEDSWQQQLESEFLEEYMRKLKAFLRAEMDAGKKIFPRPSEYFQALNSTPFDQVKVVIVGQDPYHGPGQAHGLCFSVQPGVRPPPSLLNIYKELTVDIPGFQRPAHGHLLPWARQGILLLNSVLTVEESKPASHQGQGWEKFTDKVIEVLSERRENLVFVLWGAYAIKKGRVIDRQKHFVIEGVHPSPLSASRGFLGSRPFSKINSYLSEVGQSPIDWQI